MKTQHAPAATVRTLNTLDIFVRSIPGQVRVRPGSRVRFHGRLKGRPVPGRGKLMEQQGFDAGR